MDNRLIIRPEAELEMLEAYNWYEEQREGLGSEFRDAIDASVLMIMNHPGASPVVYKDARRAVVNRFPYCLYYRFRNNTITILTCFHTSRDPTGWQSRIEESTE